MNIYKYMMIGFVHLLTYLGISLIYASLDFFRIFDKYKISKYPVLNQYTDSSSNVILNIGTSAFLLEYFTFDCDIPILSIWTLIVLVGSMITSDFWFFMTHRYCHINKVIYEKVHYEHHYNVNAFAFSGMDCHFLEHIICNAGSVVIGPLIAYYFGVLNNTLFTIIIVYSTFATCVSHSGYNFCTLLNGSVHDAHHQLRVVNFGHGFMLFDRLYGTYL